MPRVIYVKKARKPNSVVTQADIDRANAPSNEEDKNAASYYWAGFKTGPRSSMKKFWKTRPPQSQLTQSEFWSAVYSLQEEAADMGWEFDDLESQRDDVAQRLREIGEEQREKFDNMPEGLQQGDTGQLLEQRADSCESVADEIESLEVPDEGEFDPAEEEGDLDEWKDGKAEEFKDELISLLDGVEG
jgi:hypothetical protein